MKILQGAKLEEWGEMCEEANDEEHEQERDAECCMLGAEDGMWGNECEPRRDGYDPGHAYEMRRGETSAG